MTRTCKVSKDGTQKAGLHPHRHLRMGWTRDALLGAEKQREHSGEKADTTITK